MHCAFRSCVQSRSVASRIRTPASFRPSIEILETAARVPNEIQAPITARVLSTSSSTLVACTVDMGQWIAALRLRASYPVDVDVRRQMP